jgi:rsbT co-antagonist protein RsbR
MIDGRLTDAALGVFPEPLAIVDRSLATLKLNAAWSAAFTEGESPLGAPAVVEALQRVFAGEAERAECTYRIGSTEHAVVITAVPDGPSRAALLHARPRPAVTDIAAPLLRRVLDLLPIAVGVVDADGKSLFVNETAARVMGHSLAEIEGRNHSELFSGSDATLVREVEARVFATGTEEIVTSDLNTPMGTRSLFFHFIPMEGQTPAERLVVTVGQDVTDQLRAERDLREQQDFIRQVIDSDPNLIFVKDDRGHFLLVNQAFASIFGKAVEEVVGQHEARMHDESDAARAEAFLDVDARVLRTLEEITLEECVRWYTGEDRWYQTTKRPLVRPNGEVHVLGFSVDITARRETQRKLEEAASEVERRAAEAFRQAEAKAVLVEELDQKLAIIDAQHQEILTLSAPLLDVGEDVLAVPIIGAMNEARAEEIMNRLLAAIVERQVHRVVLDLTGLDSIETNTADHLMRIVRAIRLLGAEAIITGIRPAVAQTIVELGIELSDLTTRRTLRQAIFNKGVRPNTSRARR